MEKEISIAQKDEIAGKEMEMANGTVFF